MKKKLLFFTSRLPGEPVGGRESSLHYYCKYLHSMYGLDIVVVSFSKAPGEEERSRLDFISKTYLVRPPRKLTILKNILKAVFISGWPIQVCLFYSPEIRDRVKEIVEQERPDYLMADMVRTAEFLKDFPIPKILDLDDMLSIRYKRQLELKGGQTNPFGQYARQIPSLVSKVLNSRFVQRMVLKYEAHRLAKYEIAISRQFDAIVLVSALETDLLNKILGEQKAFAVPAGVEMSLFDPGQKEKSGNIISFLGLYSSSHNEDTALHLCHNILPEIKKSVPDVKLRLIGGGLTKRVEDLAKNPSVEVTGKVPAVQDYLRTSKVFVAPFRFGSGVKTKILEAMALKLPVVTNSIGEEGMNIENKGILVVEDDPRDFVKAVVRLLQDEALREELGEKGRRFVIENFAYTQTMKQWAKVLSHLDSRCSRTSGA